ncbi:glutamate-ammonia-ligase adenylyltransferase [Marinibacterium profundimaris]|uniref:Glutamate-ammonia-ligase adenylyltransferase n=1 Tax=Marinibacterium profundimaris TaxID=1679460 RepID=A0A225P1N5_9RHOB|nr:glutamate-ammonia-ligase adenylyltransferase [Marinibacterium profundimaris]
MTRLPRPLDPDLGAEAAARLPGLTGDLATLIEGAAGCSPYLHGLISREAEWLGAALEAPDAALDQVMTDLRETSGEDLARALRRAKRRVALMTALGDIAGAWPLETVTGRLTDLAGLACDAAIRAELATLDRRGKLPAPVREDGAGTWGLCVLAMGKMGAHELNYSSDIDLICLFDDTLYDDADVHDARQVLVRVTRNMSSLLSERTAEGYVFRTDLRLRPDPSVTPVCLSMAAAESYYESFGRTWERAAMIKARPAAGDVEAGARFLEDIRPFIWRRHLDFAAIEDAHAIRQRIRDAKRLHGKVEVPGHDMKLGRGGIREIEFFTQTRQLIAGGRDPELRMRGTVPALLALAEKGWIPGDVATRLRDHYRAFREIEHRIQMVNDAQTHKMPTSEEGIARVAGLMGLEPREMLKGIARRLDEVAELTEDFFAPDTPAKPAPEAQHEFDKEVLARWPTYPALRSDRAVQIFGRLRPQLLERLSRAVRPDEALLAFDRFLAGLPAGVQLFSLFQSNTELIDLLIDVIGTAPALGDYLSRNAGVLDAVIGGAFFAPWPGAEALAAEIAGHIADEDDYELKLDAARRWKKEWHFRVGVHHLRGLIDAETAGQHYADLADAVIRAVGPAVVAEFARKHGAPPGRGAAILGMGSVGARHMNAASDLDLIVIYDSGDVDSSDGRRPLATRTYYARLTQALITAMTAPMAQGRLYEIDMRLRPSGKQGPVATSWPAYRNYQQTEAWLWEHLALTRARGIVGPEALLADIESFRSEIIARPRALPDIVREVSEMRARLAAAKAPAGWLDLRNGAGRLQDLELLAQAGHLLAGQPTRGARLGLAEARDAGWLSPGEAATLTEVYELFWALHTATRLIGMGPAESGAPGQGAADFLCRSGGVADMEALQALLEARYDESAAIIKAALLRGGTENGSDN